MKVDDHNYYASAVVRQLYEKVLATNDSRTATAVSRLLAQARAVHRALDVEHISPGVEVIVGISRSQSFTEGETIGSLRSLQNAPQSRNGISVHVLPGGDYKVAYRTVDATVAPGCVKYIIDPYERESVVTETGSIDIDPFPGLVSPFALSYFRDLEGALQDYYDFKARRSNDPHLKLIWADPERLVLSNRPEQHMRRSLHDFLSTRLRDAEPEVIQEQNVNETEPVDIRIQWLDTNRISLLEVKWLGDSLNPRGEIATRYREARAMEGYQQTLDYVRSQRVTLANHIVRGQMVLFDARREGVELSSDGSFSSEDRWGYQTRDVDYSKVAVVEVGVEEPRRFFLEPTEEPSDD